MGEVNNKNLPVDETERSEKDGSGITGLKASLEEWSKNLYFKIGCISGLFILYTIIVVVSVRGKLSSLNESTIDEAALSRLKYSGAEICSQMDAVKHETDVIATMSAAGKELTDEEVIALILEAGRAEGVAVLDAEGNGTSDKSAEVKYDLSAAGEISPEGGFCYINDKIMFVRAVKLGERDAVIAVAPDTYLFDAILDKEQETVSFARKSWYLITDTEGRFLYKYDAGASYVEESDDLYKLADRASASSAAKTILSDLEKHNPRQKNLSFDKDKRRIYYNLLGDTGWYILCGSDIVIMENKQAARDAVVSSLTLWMVIGIILFIAGIVWAVIVEKNKGKVRDKGLTKLAETDQLTGLLNKVSTENKIKQFMTDHPESQSMFFILDIDNFKKINDTMGHAFGDEVLREIGHRIKMEFRASDIIGRAGGDEFIIFLRNIPTDDLLHKEAQKVLNVFKDFRVGTYSKYTVTASIGCAIFPGDGGEWEALYKAADQGLYKAKRGGKNQLVFYRVPGEEKTLESEAVSETSEKDEKDD